MAQHGYLGDGFGMRGDHGDDDYGRSRDRDRDRERGFGDRERSFGDRDRFRDNDRERNRNFMFDEDRQSRSRDDWNHGRREREGWGGDPNRMSSSRRSQHGERDDDRGFMDRAWEKAQGWFGDDDADHRSQQQNRGWNERERDQRPTFGGFGNQTGWESIQRSRPSPHRDDHYRSWRDRQMQALDRDYEEYCRDCEQKFHQDFDSWRQNRQQQQQGSEQRDLSRDDDQEVRMASERPSASSPRAGTDPQGGGLNTGRTTEVGAGSEPGQGATSVGAGSELGGATGTFVNEGTGGNSGGRKKTV